MDGHLFPFSLYKFINHTGLFEPNQQLRGSLGCWQSVPNERRVARSGIRFSMEPRVGRGPGARSAARGQRDAAGGRGGCGAPPGTPRHVAPYGSTPPLPARLRGAGPCPHAARTQPVGGPGRAQARPAHRPLSAPSLQQCGRLRAPGQSRVSAAAPRADGRVTKLRFIHFSPSLRSLFTHNAHIPLGAITQ